jgi:TonB-dependent starch-binding outer membrane protein SusC
MKKRLLLLLSMALLTIGSAIAQRTITGSVKDEKGEAMIGASIVVKGTTTGTIADADGKFSLNVPKDAATLVISFTGFTTQEIAIGASNTVDVTLAEGNALEELVIVGYGSQTKREVSGSISKVSAEEIENMPVQSFDRALQGRAAGVQVTSASGAPGSAVSVRIRGTGSITAGNEPLYVVDGVQISSTSANNVNNNTTVSNNPLGFLNPNDIASIEIIKDAASAAIYGAAAANGVVLVTTKKGKSGKPRFTVNMYRGTTEQFKSWDVLNSQEYTQVRAEAFLNQSRATTGTDLGIDSMKRRVMAEVRLPVTTDPNSVQTYDWQKEAWRTGQLQNYEMSASGGNEKNTYNISGSYTTQDANVINIDFRRGTAAMSLNNKMADWLQLDTRINVSTSTQRGLFGGPGGGSFLGSPAFSAPLILPMNRIYNDDGSYFGAAPGNLVGVLNQNVVQVGSLNKINSRVDQFVGTFRPIITLAKNLTVTPSVSLDYRTTKSFNYQDATTADAFAVNGRITEERGQNSNFLANTVINYTNTFADNHKLTALAGAEYRAEAYEEIFAVGTGIASPTFKTLSTTAVPVTTTGFGSSFKRAGGFGSLGYSFKDKYNLKVNVRSDGSSRFGANFRFGTFAGVSGSWVVSEESFLKDVKAVDFLKIRAGYGRTGNDQIGNFLSRGLYGVGGQIGFTNGVYNGLPGVQFSNLASPDLTWEQNTTAEAGMEVGLFKDAIFLDIGYYNRLSSKLLLDQPLAWTNGIGTVTRNVGEMVNKGWEFALTLKPFRVKNFEWKTSFTGSIIDNKVTKLYDGIVKQPTPDSLTLLSLFDINGVGITVAEGYPVGAIFTSRYAGVNPATGRPMWYDAFGNPTYVVQNPRDFKIVGSGFANVFGGINTSISYGDPKTTGVLTLDVFFQGEFGRKALDGTLSFLSENGGRTFNTLQSVYDTRWTTPGQLTATPRPYNGNAEIRASGQGTGDRFVRDASYVRLKNVALSYNFSNNFCRKIQLSNLSIYAQGFNLVTWTKWTGLDPEFVNLAGNGTNGQLPLTRNYQFGLKLGF